MGRADLLDGGFLLVARAGRYAVKVGSAQGDIDSCAFDISDDILSAIRFLTLCSISKASEPVD